MENAGSILLLVFTGLAVTYLGYRISKERERLRETVAILAEIAAAL